MNIDIYLLFIKVKMKVAYGHDVNLWCNDVKCNDARFISSSDVDVQLRSNVFVPVYMSVTKKVRLDQ